MGHLQKKDVTQSPNFALSYRGLHATFQRSRMCAPAPVYAYTVLREHSWLLDVSGLDLVLLSLLPRVDSHAEARGLEILFANPEAGEAMLRRAVAWRLRANAKQSEPVQFPSISKRDSTSKTLQALKYEPKSVCYMHAPFLFIN